MMKKMLIIFASAIISFQLQAQSADSLMINKIMNEANNNSQLKKLAHELLDVIGPRLVGTPQMKQAGDWAVANYQKWGINAKIENWGEWVGWERGASHIDLISPRVRSLEGTQLAWSPGTNGKAVTAEAVILPLFTDSMSFKKWLPSCKGKFVLVSMAQPTGRPDQNWEEFGTKESFEAMKKDRASQTEAWSKRVAATGLTNRTLPAALDNAGAAGVISSTWSAGFGVNKIFGAYTTKCPSIDLSLEDYGLVYRLAEAGDQPKLTIKTDSKKTAPVPTFNVVAEIKGIEKPNEYVMLSAHFDSWDGASGATDNGTGTLTMMEAMRILKLVYPNPKRTILVGHWGSEEQGLNGSRAFVEDHPEIVSKIQVLFNQDNGTGRIANISGQGFLNSYDYIGRWLAKVPASLRTGIETRFPGSPGAGGSDFASFIAAGAPAFSLSSTSWSYGSYTWHTNRDTYDKIVFDDLKSNAILAAILIYQASEDPSTTSRDKSILPVNPRTGEPGKWPVPVSPNRKGGM